MCLQFKFVNDCVGGFGASGSRAAGTRHKERLQTEGDTPTGVTPAGGGAGGTVSDSLSSAGQFRLRPLPGTDNRPPTTLLPPSSPPPDPPPPATSGVHGVRAGGGARGSQAADCAVGSGEWAEPPHSPWTLRRRGPKKAIFWPFFGARESCLYPRRATPESPPGPPRSGAQGGLLDPPEGGPDPP